MERIDVVCLCAKFDIKAKFGDGFAETAPELRLLRPDEVTDPATIRYGFANRPGPDAFAPFPNLELVCSAGAGVDGLLLNPGLPQDVLVSRIINPAQAEMMAGFAAYYVIAWHRQLWAYPENAQAGLWRQEDISGPEAFPVAVLGYGAMGAATGRALRALGYPVTGWAGRARDEDGVPVLSGEDGLARVLSDSRAVINMLPLTPQTRGIFNAGTLGQMRPDAILVQLGRGAHLVEDDLIPALEAGRPGLAALDVTGVEPLPADHPFWRHPKIRVTPHVASLSSGAALGRIIADTILAVEAGERPVNIVERARGY